MTTIVEGVPEGDARRGFARILSESFPEGERDDPSAVLASIAAGERRCFAAYDGTALVAVAVLLPLQRADAVLLEYLAVDAAARRGGIGGALLEHVVASLGAAPPRPAGLIFEVERPDDGDEEERELRRRRVNFYERHGAEVVAPHAHYRAPSTTGPEEIAYLLMWRPLTGAPLTAEGLARIAEAVLVEEYECAPDSALVRSVVASIRS